MSRTEARREDALRLVGSVASNRAMQGELLRLVKRSPFEVRLPRPRREGSGVLLFPFDPAVAWVAAVYLRSCSRVLWDLASSTATRLDPLAADLAVLLGHDERWLSRDGEVRFTVEVGSARDFEAAAGQVRGAVRSAVEDAARRHGRRARVDAHDAQVVFEVQRVGRDEARRTLVSLDLGGPQRHRRGYRAVEVEAPLRETLAAQLVLASRWDARTEPLVDPMAGGGTIVLEACALARGTAVRRPSALAALELPAFGGLPGEAPDLFTGTEPHVLACDVDGRALAALRENVAAAGRSGSIAVLERDVARLDRGGIADALPGADVSRGVVVVNPPYGRRLDAERGPDPVGAWRALGTALRALPGWRAAVLVAAEEFLDVLGLEPISSRPAAAGSQRGAIHLFEMAPRDAG